MNFPHGKMDVEAPCSKEDSKNNFLHHYQVLHFKQKDNDVFKTSSLYRNSTFLAFQESLKCENNALSHITLDLHLHRYEDLADAPNGFIETVLKNSSSTITSQHYKTDLLIWRSSLGVDTCRSTGTNHVSCCQELMKPNQYPLLVELHERRMKTTNTVLARSPLEKNYPSPLLNTLPESKSKPWLEGTSKGEIPKLTDFFLSDCKRKENRSNMSETELPLNQLQQKCSGTIKKGHSSLKKFIPPYKNYNSLSENKNEKNVISRPNKAQSSLTPNQIFSKVNLEAQMSKNVVNFCSSEIPPNIFKKQSDRNSPVSSNFKTASTELLLQNKKKGVNQGGNQKPPQGLNKKFSIPYKKEEPTDESIENLDEIFDERLKNICPNMVEMIRSEIMDVGNPVGWDDIAGLEFAKTKIKEIVVWPLLRPDIFTGLRGPPKGILLFGPPGTGKTLIGKCIASQSKSTFFSISASSLTSKWVGNGEKMVRALFAVARCHQPAVVFIDEIDSLLSQRSDTEHESSRRIKTEFLVQLDGATTADNDRILVVGATNRPQELDEAARRRLVKRLYIPLPELEARGQIVNRLMATQRCNLSQKDVFEIAELTEGFSGADMRDLCREAAYGPIRSIDVEKMEFIREEEVRPIIFQDFKEALLQVRPSVSADDLNGYEIWNKTFGCGHV